VDVLAPHEAGAIVSMKDAEEDQDIDVQ